MTDSGSGEQSAHFRSDQKVLLAEDLWAWQDDDGLWWLSRPLATDARTGQSLPGATLGRKVVLFKGQAVRIVL